MPRYIDAEKLEKDGWWASRTYQQDTTTNVYETKKMTDFPIVDVVEVVRCKDCKHLSDCRIAPEWNRICRLQGVGKSDDGYCDEGKRKEVEDGD